MNKGVVQISCSLITKNEDFPFQNGSISKVYGTGFIFSKDKSLVLTCAHCVEDCVQINVKIPSLNEKQYEAKVVSICHLYDIALIKILDFKEKNIVNFPINKNGLNKIKAGDKVQVYGYPLGFSNIKITEGIVSGHQFSQYQVDCPVNGGNSGGPLIHDNKIVGIVSSKFLFAENTSFVIPIERFLNIETIMKKKKLVFPPDQFGFCLQKNPYNENSAYIFHIIPETLIEKSKPKIKNGDILLQLGKYKVNFDETIKKKWLNENETFQNFLFSLKPNTKIPFQIKRNKKIIKGYIPIHEMKPKLSHPIYPIDTLEYCMVGGMIICTMSYNVFQKSIRSLFTNFISSTIRLSYLDFLRIFHYFEKLKNSSEKNILVIVNILQGSESEDYFSSGDILEKVNDKPISSLYSLVNMVYKNKNIKKLNFETNLGKKYIVTKEDIMKETLEVGEKYDIKEMYNLKKKKSFKK